eukprot:g11049.t1
MSESLALAGASEVTPRGGGASAGDGSTSLSKRGKGAGYGQSRAKAAQQREHVGVLSKPVFRRHVMKELTKEEIQAMVDLAYWSDFDTSRRDAASAFATLSMNEHNVDVLDRAGVLGAVLALIAREAHSVRKKRPLSKASADCLQDASWCLRRMLRRDDIKSRFLEAPGGLTNVLALTGSEEVSLRHTAARVVRGLSRSPHTTPKSLMDADIVRFLLCLLEEGDEPAAEQEEALCIAYFTKVSSDEEACSELAELGLSRYLIRVLPERRLSLQNRLAMLEALERMAGSPRCEGHLIDEGLFEALVGLCFNEIASFVHGCQNYLRQRREIEGVGSPAAGTHDAATSSSPRDGGGAGGTDGGRGGGGARSASMLSAAGGVGGIRRKEVEGRFTEEDRLSFVAQGPLDAIMRCLRGGRATQQQCALDALTMVCLLAETKPLVFCREVLNEVLMLAAVQEHVQSAAFVLHQFALLPEWRAPLVRGGCLELLVNAIAHATGPEAPSPAEACRLLGSAVAALRYITKLEGAGRALVEAGGLPQLLRLSRSEHDNIRRDASQALKHMGHKSRDREKKIEAPELPEGEAASSPLLV